MNLPPTNPSSPTLPLRRRFLNETFPSTVSWRTWWNSQTPAQKLIPLVCGLSYLALIHFLSQAHLASAALSAGAEGVRPDHVAVVATVLLLWYLGPRFRALFKFLIPLLLVALVYDSMRYYADYIRGPIHVTQPYSFDKTFFGISTPEGRLTPNEWWQKHTYWPLDLVTGFFYLFFITIYVLVCVYLCFWLPLTGTRKHSAQWIREQAFRPMWAFFWVNMIGYSTYYWYAAAPPWYVSDHGLGPADMSVAASAAGALRFDALLGTHFFSGMYGRAADVFGAVPSLHVAYPLQAVYYAHRYGALKKFTIFFYLIMCFSAIYLNHHYVLDILWGSAYALLVCMFLDRFGTKHSAGLT